MLIKCPCCGYQKGSGWVQKEGTTDPNDTEYKEINESGKEFITIIGSFHTRASYDRERRVELIACPECKTVILED